MYEPRAVFEKVKCSKEKCKFYDCENDYVKNDCYSEYLEEQNKLMLEALIETYLSIDSPIRVMDKSAIRKLIEQITQKKIEEIL